MTQIRFHMLYYGRTNFSGFNGSNTFETMKRGSSSHCGLIITADQVANSNNSGMSF